MRWRYLAICWALAVATVSAAGSALSEEKSGVSHTLLLRTDVQGAPGKELIVLDTVYLPGGINPKHYHPAQITFYVLEGTGIWQEAGKPPVTLKSGDILMVTPGTVHAHWNPSGTTLRFLEFVIVDKGQRSSVPMR